ncbi:major facilitator superfamily MFS_1 [Rhodopseudomonas palustris BisB5]|uniref:Major facilitator superfamily MFS_1 n=1 Tax=Rhodopseudomonas palustris (strain BisB5) TaxID=316057 RepID=Q12ZY6_RHOPS|nr:major facilitator superfamily MFS_1 [Rhodopseudomonas palustris BisB5]
MAAIPPDDETSIRYGGWRIVAVCFAVATFGWAFGFYGQSVYLAELTRLHGWPSSLIATATTFFYLGGALLVAFVGDAIRMIGARACLLGGIAAMALGTALLGRIDALWQLYAVYVLLAIGWAGTSLGAVTSTLGLWFDQRRGMAISLALNGASFGGIAGVPLLVAAIEHLGFAGATLAAAVVSVVVLMPIVAIFVGRPPQRAAAHAAGPGAVQALSSGAIRRHAFRDTAFLTVTIAFALVLFAQVGFIVHLIAYLDPLVGRERAAVAVSLLTTMAVVGRVSLSTVIDRLDQRLVSAISFASQAAALAIVILSRDATLLLVACALFGFSVGNLITLPALIVQREFAPGSFGVLVSLNTAINQVTYAFGPGVVGLLRDASGSYTAPFLGCIALQLIAAMLVMVRGRS